MASRLAVVSLHSGIDRAVEVAGLAAGETLAARFVSEIPSGKGANVARALGELGVEASLFGLVGEDRAAQFAASFAATSIACRLTAVPIRTRVNTTIIDPGTGAVTHLRESSSAVAEDDFREFGRRLLDDLDGAEWAVFSGSVPPGVTPEVFAGLVAAARDRRARVAVDSSGPALACAVATGIDLIKPNREELEELMARPVRCAEDIVAAGKELVARHPRIEVLASDGDRGAWLIARDGAWHAIASRHQAVRKAVGAGDALLAGFLAARFDGATADRALARGVAVALASLACTDPGRIDRERLDEPVTVNALG